MKTMPLLVSAVGLSLLTHRLVSSVAEIPRTDPAPAAQAINTLGLELLAKATSADANALLSPYSIQTALAMTFAGSAGATRAEMAKVLRYGGEEAELHRAFAALQKSLQNTAGEPGDPDQPVTLTVANRLFAQQDYEFRAPFVTLLTDIYGAPVQPIDFIRDPADATKEINGWVEEHTRRRIRDLIPPGVLRSATRLVLVNAIYLMAPWADEFLPANTKPYPFHAGGGGQAQDVPTMFRQDYYGYARREGYRAVALPYRGGELQFVVLLPDETNGLAALEATLTPELLASCANLRMAEVILYLPKFKSAPPTIQLGQALQSLGMKSAFDQPPGTANFDRMAPRKPKDYLAVSEIFHKTFLTLDEKGTEAAAASAVAIMVGSATGERPKPIEFKVDHPFLFAVQHRPSGACLFLGRVVDPR